jgi:hypothetical protein
MFNYHWSHSVHHDGSPSYVICNDYTLDATVTLRLRVDVEAATFLILKCIQYT